MRQILHKLTIIYLCSFCTPSSVFGQTQAAYYDNQVFLKWNNLFLEIDRYAAGFRPCPGPRALAYMGLSAYESVVHGMPQYNSLRGQFSDFSLPTALRNAEYYHPASVNESYNYMMHYFFDYLATKRPVEYAKIEKTYQDCRKIYLNRATPLILARSEAFGKATAKAICEWEARDVMGHNAYLNPQPPSYVPPVGSGLWQPTTPDFSKAMFPNMGNSRYFALKGAEQLALRPLPYSENPNSELYKQAEEVFHRTNAVNQRAPQSKEDRWIAEFWSDDLINVTFSPPSRLLSIANQIAKRENLNLAECAELYAKLGLALNDAGAATWKSKYYYNIERPISYIRRVLKNKYPTTAANWLTALNNPLTGAKGLTPAFPAYPSGHSAFGGAGGKILSSLFENNNRFKGNYAFADLSHLGRTEFASTPRFYTSFKQMADEDAISRIPLGVHFRMDCTEGVRLGELAAKRVLELPWKKSNSSYNLAQQPIVSFNAVAENNRIRLNWIAAANGTAIDYFTVQKQNPITHIFEPLASIKAQTTSEIAFYDSFDDNPTEGDNTYQIELTMLDGQVKTSALKTLTYKNLNDVRIYPNPASDYIEVDLKQYKGEKVTLEMYNQAGQLIQYQHIERVSATPIHIDMDKQTNNQMILRIMAEGHRPVTKKFVIQN